uniref:CCHC-type domain-containing protein n=1 Tax=Odontella aurita TaxID=265563 RepID=A0A7S4M3T5_9STRA|mmetsp:Transcript_10197/g.30133  ORF Transcript_10197/g.30133 Transcript_10197/m.30133 type:complete len:422 (+) Transcript_10197:225-1490(+)
MVEPEIDIAASSQWHVFSTINALEKSDASLLQYGEKYIYLINETISVLKYWGVQWAGNPEMQSLLNKNSLLHEIEESIVAIHILMEWFKRRFNNTRYSSCRKVLLVDLCCGKGIYSLLLSYLAHKIPILKASITKCLMVDKANVNWVHIQYANRDHRQDNGREFMSALPIECLGKVNVHSDSFAQHLFSAAADHDIALNGIHLCKHLSPRAVSLFNILGSERVPFLCLAPCCLPRLKVGAEFGVSVRLYETDEEMSRREETNARRARARRKYKVCYICEEGAHKVRDCPVLPNHSDPRRDEIIREAVSKLPCWICGHKGHQRSDCAYKSERQSVSTKSIKPPSVRIDAKRVRESETPFETYCQVLFETVGQVDHVSAEDAQKVDDDMVKRILTTELDGKEAHSQPDNWNGKRKCKWIVAER